MLSIAIRAGALFIYIALAALVGVCAEAGVPAATSPAPGVPAAVAAAVADPARPAEQIARDAERHPGVVLAFTGVGPGDRVADFMSGGAYFTRLFSRAVGDGGHVYAFLPQEQLEHCPAAETAGTRGIEGDAHYANVTVVRGPVNRFGAPEPLDLVWTSLNFHDLYDSFMGPANVPEVVAALYQALKPGGVLIIVDHVAQPGSKVRDTETLHRIDPQVIIRTVQDAGFVLEAQSDLLRNAQDSHELRVFDPAIRGRTDQVLLKFRKPRAVAAAH
jgi:predicted methyltransferase